MLFLKLKDGASYNENQQFTFDLKHKDNVVASGQKFTAQGSPVGNLPFVNISSTSEKVDGMGWSLANVVNAYPDTLDDLWIVCQYSLQ